MTSDSSAPAATPSSERSDGTPRDPVASLFIGVALLLPFFPLWVVFAVVPNWPIRFRDASAPIPGVCQQMMAGWIPSVLIALFVIQAIVLFVAATDRNGGGNRRTLAIGATVGWLIIDGMFLLGWMTGERVLAG